MVRKYPQTMQVIPDKFYMYLDADSGGLQFGCDNDFYGMAHEGMPVDDTKLLYPMMACTVPNAQLTMIYRGQATSNVTVMAAPPPNPTFNPFTSFKAQGVPPPQDPAMMPPPQHQAMSPPPSYAEQEKAPNEVNPPSSQTLYGAESEKADVKDEAVLGKEAAPENGASAAAAVVVHEEVKQKEVQQEEVKPEEVKAAKDEVKEEDKDEEKISSPSVGSTQ